MPNAIYPRWKSAVMQATANSALTGNVRLILVDAGAYTYSAAHEFLSDIPARRASPRRELSPAARCRALSCAGHSKAQACAIN